MSNHVEKEIREFVERMPKEMNLPKHWRKFINQNDKSFNIILRRGIKYYCTNCKKIFYGTRENISKGELECPFCKNIYIVKGSNLKNYRYLYDLAAIDNFESYLVLRYFEVNRSYDAKRESLMIVLSNMLEYFRNSI